MDAVTEELSAEQLSHGCQVASRRRCTPGGSAFDALQRELDFYVALHNMQLRPGDGPFHLTLGNETRAIPARQQRRRHERREGP